MLHFKMLLSNPILDQESTSGVKFIQNEEPSLGIFGLKLVIPQHGSVHYITDSVDHTASHAE